MLTVSVLGAQVPHRVSERRLFFFGEIEEDLSVFFSHPTPQPLT